MSTVDNFIKPMIISRGSDLPFILVLLGVLGGAFAFGFIGVFLGPVLLAVGFALLKEWAVGMPGAVAAPTPRRTTPKARRSDVAEALIRTVDGSSAGRRYPASMSDRRAERDAVLAGAVRRPRHD